MEKEFQKILDPLVKMDALEVIDSNCRLWDAPNVFVVDASLMPTGLGLNPMMTVVANALRVGSWMIKYLDQNKDLAKV